MAETPGVRLVEEPSTLRVEQLQGFFVGWPTPPSPEQHLAVLRGSLACVIALDGERAVGFVTAVGDGVLTAFLPWLEVLPAWQGRGIGTALVRRVLARLEGSYSIDLVCDEDLVPFYQRLGLMRLPAVMGLRDRRPLQG